MTTTEGTIMTDYYDTPEGKRAIALYLASLNGWDVKTERKGRTLVTLIWLLLIAGTLGMIYFGH